jgi:colanic acid biosynthesis glycosyl transferase WcaI
MATGQYLTQLAVCLTERGHNVTVITSDRGYDDPSVRFPARETWKNIEILRIPSLSLGKRSKWRRALNFASFLTICSLRLLFLKRSDVVVGLTSPPLISFLGALFVRLKGGRFCFWVMDLNPDEAIAAGWLKDGSAAASVLQRVLLYSLRHSDKIIVLDRFMKDRILSKGINERQVVVIPPWSHEDTIQFDSEGREAFRTRCGIRDKFVVMYSGNHSPCHPLDTLLQAARATRTEQNVSFYFVGGGSEQAKVRRFAADHQLQNITCLPYQPLDQLGASLSAADLHVVAMGNEFVGIVHPSKVYNILAVGAPILYIGPSSSHVTDIARESPNRFFIAEHGDVSAVVDGIKRAVDTSPSRANDKATWESIARFSKQELIPQFVTLLESSDLSQAILPEVASGEVGALGD